MAEIIKQIVEQFGYAGIFFLIALENIFPPIPSELILAFGGFMATKSNISLIGAIIAATCGSLLGALVLYFFGLKLGQKRIYSIVQRHKKLLRLSPSQLDKAFAIYSKHQNSTVFLCRMMPILRSIISLPAGLNKMRLDSFILLTAFGSLIWNSVLIFLGAALGENWERVVQFFKLYSWAFYALFGIIIAFIIVKIIFKKRKKC